MSEEKKYVEIVVSETLGNLVRNLERSLSPGQFSDVVERLSAYLALEKKELEAVPKGATRARIIQTRVQRSIDAFFKNEPRAKAKTSCFTCTQSGCCSTNVDISDSEATLYAEMIRSGAIDIDLERLERQGIVDDRHDASQNIEA